MNTATYSADFTQGAAATTDWTTTSGEITYDAQGGNFSIGGLGSGPTMQTNFYMFFGYVEVTMQAAPGAGIVSSFVMESDDLDEVDWVCNLLFLKIDKYLKAVVGNNRKRFHPGPVELLRQR